MIRANRACRAAVGGAVLSALLTGCATSQPELDVADISAEVAARLEVPLDPSRLTGPQAPAPAGGRLSLDDAIAFAINNNAMIRDALNAIGIAESQLLAAGLLPNPVLGVAARLPDRSPRGMNVEFNLFGSVIDLLQRPQRTRARAANVDNTIFTLGATVMTLAADVERAYIRVRGAQHKTTVLTRLNEAASASSMLATELHRAGNLSELNMAQAVAFTEQTEIELLRAKLEVEQRRARLAMLLGVGDPGALPPTDRVQQALPAQPPVVNDPVRRAFAQRLELAAAQKVLAARTVDFELAKDWGWLQAADIGISGERDSDRQLAVGPALTTELPIFNRGQATQSMAAANLKASEIRIDQLRVAIENDVYRTRQTLERQHAIVRRYADKLLPVRKKINALSQKHHKYMLISTFDVTMARAQTLRAEVEYIDALTDYWVADAAFRRAVGGQRGPAS